MTEEQLLTLAMQMREEIKGIPVDQRPVQFQEFPEGSCSDASLILGTLIQEVDDGLEVELVSAERGSRDDDTWTSHAWLEVTGFIIDITCDQYSDCQNPILQRAPSEWHAQFKEVRRLPVDAEGWPPNEPEIDLRPIYKRLKEKIDV